MPLTPEERARISRENGAKSKGPATAEGKARSSKNASKEIDQELADDILALKTPHPAVIYNEDANAFASKLERYIAIYKPANEEAVEVVHDIVTARWTIDRLKRLHTAQWNMALIRAGKMTNELMPELFDLECTAHAGELLVSGVNSMPKILREIERLQRSIGRNERRLKFLNANFPATAPAPEEKIDQNEPDPIPQPTDDYPIDESLPPIFITENVPLVIEYYKKEFPGRRIIIVPPSTDDPYKDYGPVPRRAA